MYKIKTAISLLVLSCFFIACKKDTATVITEEKEIKFNLPYNFVLEDLYRPSIHEQGSWVALAQGDGNIMYASDQYGKIYRFKTPKEGDTLNSNNVHPLDFEIGEAHGLLWAFNSLYVAVNKKWDDEVPDEQENGSGVYKITDTDNDGELDKVEMLLKLKGAGEHGGAIVSFFPLMGKKSILLPEIIL
ncbi:hypothetical protein MNBD_BACTEROID03-967 [hydrothermal vent metagenome]|uniref:Uncharacterized protein n=1 Tax=hydrothermal vent metagenome TaxID=652676 RepID=A0A3B0THJ6_9ZZZZ